MKLRGLIAGIALAALCLGANVEVVDQIVARVNGDIISQDELQRLTRELAQDLKSRQEMGSRGDQEFQNRQKDILRDRIDELLLIQKGKELNINVDPEVSKHMANLQRQANITDPDKFREYVRQQTGMSYEDFLAEQRNQFLTRQVIGQEVARHISITNKDIQDYYDQHKSDFVREEKVFLSEILISIQGKDPNGIAAAEKKAKQIAADAAKGQRFSDLARDNSDAATAKQGGELGGYKKGDLKKEMEDAVWTLPKGSVTQPIRISTGFEIFKVEDHTKSGLAPLADVRSEIENILYGPRMQPKVREYLTQLRKTAFLQIKPGFLDSGAAPGQNTAWQDPAQLKPETVTKAEVQEKTRKKRLFGMLPIPGTQTTMTGKSSSR